MTKNWDALKANAAMVARAQRPHLTEAERQMGHITINDKVLDAFHAYATKLEALQDEKLMRSQMRRLAMDEAVSVLMHITTNKHRLYDYLCIIVDTYDRLKKGT